MAKKIIRKTFTNYEMHKELVFKICEEHLKIRTGTVIQKKNVKKLIMGNYQKR